jgi:hypothetical protein
LPLGFRGDAYFGISGRSGRDEPGASTWRRAAPKDATGQTQRTPLGLDLDYDFTFRIVGGEGVVSSR